MNFSTQRVKGMKDLLPNESNEFESVVNVMKNEAKIYGFNLIRTPVLEHTELFERSAGDSSDIVEKEMYTFKDKGGRSVTLRPEGTAGVLRAVVESGLHNNQLPLRLMYISSCYRYEKPQSGRYREFNQFGLEIFGSKSYLADAELICIANSIINRLGIKNVQLEINSIGCSSCRKKYSNKLKNYFSSHTDKLCNICRERLSRNPMRIFDCKSDPCIKICENAPSMLNFICEECHNHFENLKNSLNKLDIPYTINPKIVRGLDYYSKNVFEFICNTPDGKLTICGGGRYDDLSKFMGGPELPAIGFGMGIERILMAMQNQKIDFMDPDPIEFFIATADGSDNTKLKAFQICENLRKSSIKAQMDISERSLKSQMKYANKINAQFVIVLGKNELLQNKAKIKKMSTGKETDILIDDNLIKNIINAQYNLQ